MEHDRTERGGSTEVMACVGAVDGVGCWIWWEMVVEREAERKMGV